MLEIQHISKTFHPNTIHAKKALVDLSLRLEDGDFATVIGGNGAGKSTLLNAIAGSFPVDTGKIALDGVDMTAMDEHARARYLGRVFQDPMVGTAPSMQIVENLAIAARRGKRRGLRWGVTAEEVARYRTLLKEIGLGLEDRLTTKVELLSGGQRQALTLVMATLQRPKLLLLDEHTAALDPNTAANVLDITARVVEQSGLTTLMITHNMRDALRLGNRLLMLDRGRIIMDIGAEEKKRLSVDDLLAKFREAAATGAESDTLLLS